MKITALRGPYSNNWVRGTCGDYNYEAKVYRNPSTYGINNGRVSKLYLSDNDGEIVFEYDRGPEGGYYYKDVSSIIDRLTQYLEVWARLNV